MSKPSKQCTYIDGIASSQAIDTAGEIVDLKGLDISSLVGAALNWEHHSNVPAQLVGKILEAKKIFSEEDCENDRHRKYWKRYEIPFLYIMGRLFDDKKPSSVEVAALFHDDAEHPEEKPMVSFSVEGARLGEKSGMVVPRSIARKVTITNMNANKTCDAEVLPVKHKKDTLESMLKGEMELFKFEPTYREILEKKEVEMDLQKALDAGSALGAAPSQLTQGAALGKEELEKRSKKVNEMSKKEKTNWYERADNAYQNWSDRENFRSYMKKRMPHLAGGEVDAIGRILALKKDMDREGKMNKMYASYFNKAETSGHERGVHLQVPSQKPGVSYMGQQVRRAKALSDQGKSGYGGHYKANFTAKMHSENTSKQAAAIPKPSLKSEDVKKGSDIMMASEEKSKK